MPDFSRFDQAAYDEQTRLHRLKLRRTRKGRLFLTSFCILVIMGALIYAFVYADSLWIYIADRYFNNRINAASAQQGGGWDNHRLNIMIIGVDQRNNEPSRSDTLMVAMLNLKDKTVQVISIPRDTRVKIEGLANPTRINHAYANGGTELARKTAGQLLGTPIHNYIETNFSGFENIIDSLGGVEVDVEKRMYYPAEDINLRKGPQRLDGHDALSYVRYRSDGKGDLPRIKRQHRFLGLLAVQVLQPKTLLKLPEIAGELHSNVKTDMSTADLLVLISEFKNISPDNIRFSDIPGLPQYINGASYYVVDEEELKLYMDKILTDEIPAAAPGIVN